MISYRPLWETLRKRGVTTYSLIRDYSFSRGALDSLRQGRNVTLRTVEDLCRILRCEIQDIVEYIPDEP